MDTNMNIVTSDVTGSDHLEKPISQLIRSKNGNPRGILVAGKIDGRVLIGWSLCNTRLDLFNKDLAKEIAWNRLYKESGVPIPFSIQDDYMYFVNRCKRYYKVNDIDTQYEFATRPNSLSEVSRNYMQDFLNANIGNFAKGLR